MANQSCAFNGSVRYTGVELLMINTILIIMK